MQQHISILEICKEDKDECIKVYGGKVEMTQDIHFLTLQYLREIKAYHFKNKDDEQLKGLDKKIKGEIRIVYMDICICFGKLFDFLSESSH